MDARNYTSHTHRWRDRQEHVTLRRDADPFETEPLVKFRLFYEGPLYGAKGDAQDGQKDRRRGHKHAIRMSFHRQLKRFWQTHPWLKESRAGWDVLGIERPQVRHWSEAPYMWEHLAALHNTCGHRFVPLVCEQFKLLCEMDVLLLRRDRPGGIFQSRDIDNRLKILFDALRMPKNGMEIGDENFTDDEDPCFVLLQDDSLINNVTVETDELLAPQSETGGDDSYCDDATCAEPDSGHCHCQQEFHTALGR